jgi:hypothetical protein
MTLIAFSRGGVPVRLTDERWTHIVEEHAELAEMHEDIMHAIADAERVVAGGGGELLAIRLVEVSKAIVVVYREISPDDGFVITAFLTKQLSKLKRRQQVWP